MRTNLLVYTTGSGALEPVRNRADWARRRAEIIRGMESIMGPLPRPQKRCPLDMHLQEERQCDGYVRQLISYSSEPGSRAPAFLLLPDSAKSGGKACPGVLALHPTDMEYGHRVVVEPLRSHYPVYAAELARRGFVVLAPAYPLMGNYQPDLKALGYQSGTMKAIWDNIRGLDLLNALPSVRKDRFGAIGHSLGGHNAIFTSVLDERITVVVTSCGFDSFRDYMDGDIKGWTSERYMPRLADYAGKPADLPVDFSEMLAALAPRRVFVSAPLGDTNFKAQSVDRVVTAAATAYNFLGARAKLEVAHPACGHDFPPETRERAYALLLSELANQ